MQYTRREAFKVGLFGSAALALPLQRAASAKSVLDDRMPSSLLPKPFTLPFKIPPVATPVSVHDNEDCYRIYIKEAKAEILPGYQTTIWAYNGTFPGPTIKVNQGTKAKVRYINQLPLKHPKLKYTPWTSVHLHGSASLPQFDGYASDICYPGEYKDYNYPNFQPARTLWYHDHGVHHTAENVSMGQAAMYQMHDPREQALPLPKGEFDVPLIISDAMFTKTGEFLFDNNDESGMYGDVILVNGVPWPAMKVKRRKYRFRILNASVSRSYEYGLSTGDAFHVIGTDGGLMPYPQSVKKMRHIMAERYEIVIDFSKYAPGTRVTLKNTNPKNNTNFTNIDKIMAFDVVARRVRPVQQRGAGGALPGQPGDEPAAEPVGRHAADRTEAQARHVDDQRAHLGRRRREQLHARRGQADEGHGRDLGARSTGRAAGSTRCTSTSSTSRSSTETASRRSPTRRARRTSPTSARTRRSA